MAVFGFLTLTILLGIPTALIGGWALSELWGWFIVPLGAPAISVIHAVGLKLTIGFVTFKMKDLDEDRDKDFDEMVKAMFLRTIQSVCISLLIVGLGYCWHYFM